MNEYDDLVARTAERMRHDSIDEMYARAYEAVHHYVTSPTAFSTVERLDRIRAIVAAVEAVRAERQPDADDEAGMRSALEYVGLDPDDANG